jgi:hypothetical protein
MTHDPAIKASPGGRRTPKRLPPVRPGEPGHEARALQNAATFDVVRWSLVDTERLRREYPSCPSVAGLAASLGRPVHQLHWKARQMGVVRHPALVAAARQQAARARREVLPEAARARIVAEYPTHPDPAALAASLGLDLKQVQGHARRLGARRCRALAARLAWERMAAEGRQGGGACEASMHADEAILASQRPPRRSGQEEARRCRAMQLAAVLLEAPAEGVVPRALCSSRLGDCSPWRCSDAWTPAGLAAILAESGDWFGQEGGQVLLTAAGREEFAEKGPLERQAYRKGRGA